MTAVSSATPRVTAAHVRALAASGPRSVLVLTGERLEVIAPDDVWALAESAGCRLLATRSELLDSHPDLRVSLRTGEVIGPVAAMAIEVARYLTDDLRNECTDE